MAENSYIQALKYATDCLDRPHFAVREYQGESDARFKRREVARDVMFLWELLSGAIPLPLLLLSLLLLPFLSLLLLLVFLLLRFFPLVASESSSSSSSFVGEHDSVSG